MDAMTRKPAGFWTKDALVQDIMTRHVLGETDTETAAQELQAHCIDLGVHQPFEAIKADVTWYARGFRKALGLESLKEQKANGRARAEIEAQA